MTSSRFRSSIYDRLSQYGIELVTLELGRSRRGLCWSVVMKHRTEYMTERVELESEVEAYSLVAFYSVMLRCVSRVETMKRNG